MKPADAVFAVGAALTFAVLGLAMYATLKLDDAELALSLARARQLTAERAAEFFGERIGEYQAQLRDAEDRVAALAHHNDRLADDADDLRDKLHKLAHGEPLS